jgi:arylsulfatase A-like enzyme
LSEPKPKLSPQPPSAGGTLISALAAALTLSVLFGLGDSAVADLRFRAPDDLAGRVGCYAAAVLSYFSLFAAVLVPVAFLGRLLMSSTPRATGLGRLLTLGLFLGLLAELHWWTGPLVSDDHPALSPERMGVLFIQAVSAALLAMLLAKVLLRLPRGFQLLVRLLGLGSIAVGSWFLSSEAGQFESRGVINDRNRELPNVLLVVVDALRQDHLSCYGTSEVRTPNIDALAERGVLFENYFVQAPTTLPSLGSILTGKYPRRHGLVDQRAGVRLRPGVTIPLHLKSAAISSSTLSLREGDYLTATFMTGAVSNSSGLAQGFDAYSEDLQGRDLVEVDSQWSRFRSELLIWLIKNSLTQRTDSERVVTTARSWLREHAARRWMALVQLSSVHPPHELSSRLREEYLDVSYNGQVEYLGADLSDSIEAGDFVPSEADLTRIRDLYQAGAATADALFGELVAELEQLGILEDTLIIFTSDHGEDLGEWRTPVAQDELQARRAWEHDHMWQSNLRAPLVMANTRLLPHGQRFSDLVESVDLLPTMCELLGLELPRGTEPDDLIDGQSVLSGVLGTQLGELTRYQPRRYSFSESQLFLAIQDTEAKLVVPRKLVQDEDPERLFSEQHWVRFYDLSSDPEETSNQFALDSPKLRELWSALRAYDRSMPEPVYLVTESSPDSFWLLRELGHGSDVHAEELEVSKD